MVFKSNLYFFQDEVMAHNKLLLSRKQSMKELAEAAAHGPFNEGTLQGDFFGGG